MNRELIETTICLRCFLLDETEAEPHILVQKNDAKKRCSGLPKIFEKGYTGRLKDIAEPEYQ